MKSFFGNKFAAIVIFILSAALLTPIVGDCAYFFCEESLQADVYVVPETPDMQTADAQDAQTMDVQTNGAQEKDMQAENEQKNGEQTAEGDGAQSTAGKQGMDGSQGTDTVQSTDGSQSTDTVKNNADANEANTACTTESGLTDNTETENDGKQNVEEDETTYYLRINRALNVTTVYVQDEDGEYTVAKKAFVCSTGRNNRTPLGTYALSTRYRWRKMVGGVYSQYATRVHGSILIHSVPYYRQNPATLETKQYNKLGEQASLGCIRMSCEDAKWVFDHCKEGTVVEIYDDKDEKLPLGKPEAIQINTEDERKGWDPTDPDEENPWKQADGSSSETPAEISK